MAKIHQDSSFSLAAEPKARNQALPDPETASNHYQHW